MLPILNILPREFVAWGMAMIPLMSSLYKNKIKNKTFLSIK